ncbi:MAG: PhnB protein [Alphaproteobacteria bacterium]|nr:MAG: PhnB protein [Caulobacteraceae bacterium]TPW04020.1 MAG: PhnB protein [Alphaproteobacteria bacterium]
MSQVPIRRAGIAPYICVRGAAEAIDFYVAAFGAVESFRLTEPEGKVGHAELHVGDGVLMISDEYPDFGAKAPPSFGGSPVSLHLSVADCDAAVARAEAVGATVLRAPKDEFYGDRSAMVACPFGYRWHLTAAREDITPEQMQARWTAMLLGEPTP